MESGAPSEQGWVDDDDAWHGGWWWMGGMDATVKRHDDIIEGEVRPE